MLVLLVGTGMLDGTEEVGMEPAPAAAFSGTPLSGTAPLEVTFTDASTNSPTSWAWTFGDAGTSTVQNPVHTYADSGTFTVSLTATNTTGSDVETKASYITVTGITPPAPTGGGFRLRRFGRSNT